MLILLSCLIAFLVIMGFFLFVAKTFYELGFKAGNASFIPEDQKMAKRNNMKGLFQRSNLDPIIPEWDDKENRKGR